MASHVHISLPFHPCAAQSLDCQGRVHAQEDVVVPGPLVRMHEQCSVRQMIIVVDYMSQVRHRLSSFVLWNPVLSTRIIHAVDRDIDIQGPSVNPVDLFLFHSTHYKGSSVKGAVWLYHTVRVNSHFPREANRILNMIDELQEITLAVVHDESECKEECEQDWAPFSVVQSWHLVSSSPGWVEG